MIRLGVAAAIAGLLLAPETVAQNRASSPITAPLATPAPAEPAPRIAPPPGAVKPIPAGPRVPAVDRIAAACLRPGETVSVDGRGLASGEFPQTGRAWLVSGATRIALDIVSRSDNRLVVRLPRARPAHPGPWRIALPAAAGTLTPAPLGPGIRYCRDPAGAGPDAAPEPALPEILMAIRTSGTTELAPLHPDGPDTVAAELVSRGFLILERQQLDGVGLHLFRLAPPQQSDIAIALDELRQAYPEAGIDPNHLYGLADGPRRYAADAIGLGTSRVRCPVPAGLRIGMLDSGVDTSHPALRSARGKIRTASFLGTHTAGTAPGDHGTAIAALLSGDPADSTFSGLLPETELFAGEVLSESPNSTSGTAAAIVRGLDWLAGQRVDLAVLALAGPTNRSVDLALLGAADGGMMLLAAVGNAGADRAVAFPARSKWVTAISAVDIGGALYDRAQRGPEVTFVAPGVDIWVARAGGGGRYASGTSYAVPHAAAIVARVLDPADRAARGGSRAVSARRALEQSLAAGARDLGPAGRDPAFGWGLLRATDCGGKSPP